MNLDVHDETDRERIVIIGSEVCWRRAATYAPPGRLHLLDMAFIQSRVHLRYSRSPVQRKARS